MIKDKKAKVITIELAISHGEYGVFISFNYWGNYIRQFYSNQEILDGVWPANKKDEDPKRP